MCLMSILMHYKMLGYIERRQSTTIMQPVSRYISQSFFAISTTFLKLHITQNKENHIVGMVKAGSECGSILTAKLSLTVRDCRGYYVPGDAP